MARNAATAIENNFTKGLVTEATGINFPTNAATETYDCVFSQTGQLSRRLGFDIETDAQTFSYEQDDGVVREYVWRVAGNTGSTAFLVVQYGAIVRFYLVSGATLSTNLKNFSIDLTDYETSSTNPTGNFPCSFSSGNGLLFIAHPQVEPLLVEYDATLDNISVNTAALKVRDISGIDSGFDLDVSPSSLTAPHEYNLKNQGWYHPTVQCANAANSVLSASPIAHWKNVNGDYPANNHIWWAYKRGRNDNNSRTYEEVFDPTTTKYIKVGNTPAPRGHYILDAFELNRSGASGVPGLPNESTNGARPQSVAFFSGRTFWGGVNANRFNTRIYFSQVVERDEQVSLCYQAQDPTDEDVPDLLPTDGGVIAIPEMRQLIHMIPLADSLFLFATNGVWKISGSEGIGFRANDYSVIKVSEVPAISPLSFVLVENMPAWWNGVGIWTLATENGLDYQVQSLSDGSIKTFFEEIPDDSKMYAKGAYNPQTKLIQWVYSSSPPINTTPGEVFKYDRVLNLNTLTGAFYPWTISGEDVVLVRGIVSIDGASVQQSTESVLVGGDEVFVDTDQVLSQRNTTRSVQSQFKYLAHVLDGHDTLGEGITFGGCLRTDYTDWVLLGSPSDYLSYVVAGYNVAGEGDKRFQSNYVTTNYETQPDGRAYIQGLWDYATGGDTGRWTSKQQIISYEDDYRHRMAKRKIRGNGRALQVKYTSFSGSPFKINGWTIFITGNPIV